VEGKKKKKRLATHRSSAARASFQVVLIKISTSMYIKSPGANSSLIASGGLKLKHRKFCLNMRKNFFPLRVTEPWHRLPREAEESPSLEIFKSCLDKVLYSLL